MIDIFTYFLEYCFKSNWKLWISLFIINTKIFIMFSSLIFNSGLWEWYGNIYNNSSRLEEKETFPLYLKRFLIEIIGSCIEESFCSYDGAVLYLIFIICIGCMNQKWFLCRITAKVMLCSVTTLVASMQLSNKLPSKEHNSILRIKWIF